MIDRLMFLGKNDPCSCSEGSTFGWFNMFKSKQRGSGVRTE